MDSVLGRGTLLELLARVACHPALEVISCDYFATGAPPPASVVQKGGYRGGEPIRLERQRIALDEQELLFEEQYCLEKYRTCVNVADALLKDKNFCVTNERAILLKRAAGALTVRYETTLPLL